MRQIGEESKRIARVLEIAPATVDKHRARAERTMHVKNVVELFHLIQVTIQRTLGRNMGTLERLVLRGETSESQVL